MGSLGSLGTAESKLLAVRLINDARHFAVAEVGQGCRRNPQESAGHAGGVHANLQKQEDQHENEVCATGCVMKLIC